MSYMCLYNNTECDGCGACDIFGHEDIKCPVCGEVLTSEDVEYVDNATEKIIGCSYCIHTIEPIKEDEY